MLRDRLNCLRGLTRGFELFLRCPPIGDPFRDECPELHRLGRERGGAKAGGPRRGGCFSGGEESAKISDRDKEDEVIGLLG